MRFTRLARSAAVIAVALVLTASPAEAHSGHATSFTSTSYALNANANWTATFTIGPYEPSSILIDFEAGMRFAHDDQYGNELASNPGDDTVIGNGSFTAAYFFCVSSTQNATVYWEEDMTSAPGGAVAHYRVVVAGVGTYQAWLIEENDANDDYKLSIPLNPDWTCAIEPNNTGFSLALLGYAGGVVTQNPNASDCKVVTVTVTDTAGGVHTGSDSKPFGTATCP